MGRVLREQLSLFPQFQCSKYERPKGDLRKMPRTGSRRETVLRQVIKAGKRGITEEELRGKLVLTKDQIGKARLELLEGGYIMDSSVTRLSSFGDPEIVWRSSDYGQQQWKESGRR